MVISIARGYVVDYPASFLTGSLAIDGFHLRERYQVASSPRSDPHFHRSPRPPAVIRFCGWTHHREIRYLRQHRGFEEKQTWGCEPNPLTHHSEPPVESQARSSQSSCTRSKRHRCSIRQTRIHARWVGPDVRPRCGHVD